jgi:hypothetical protein
MSTKYPRAATKTVRLRICDRGCFSGADMGSHSRYASSACRFPPKEVRVAARANRARLSRRLSPRGGIPRARRPERVIPPRDTVRCCVLMALERGNLADVVFDDRTLASHRALAAVLGAILKLPPVKRALTTEQVRSVYLERLIERVEARGAT